MAYDFDRTVTQIGAWIESKRVTYDDKGRPTDHLEELLDPQVTPLGQSEPKYRSVHQLEGVGFNAEPYTLAQWEADKRAREGGATPALD